MRVLCVGHCSYDIICPVEAYPIEDNKYRIEERIDSGGGSASNAAYLLGKWGVETYMAGVIGSDDFGNKIKKELESVQVKTDNIETIFDQPTAISFILVNKQNGSRTVFSPSSKSSGQARKYDYLMNPDIILIDGYEYTASREALNRYPEAITIMDADTSSPEVLELCKYVKYIVCSKNFAETMSKTKANFKDPKSLVNMYQNLRNRFPNKEIIVTLSEHGALYAVNDEIKIMPGLNRQVKDTTGAGDIFHGAFAYGMLNRFPIEKCVSYGNIAAGLSLDKIGVRNSMPSLNEVISVYNEKNAPTGGESAEQTMPNQPVTPDANNAAQVSTEQPSSDAAPNNSTVHVNASSPIDATTAPVNNEPVVTEQQINEQPSETPPMDLPQDTTDTQPDGSSTSNNQSDMAIPDNLPDFK